MEFLKNKQKKLQFINSYSVFLLNGMLALSIGSLLPFIREARGLEYAFCGLIVSLHSVGNLVSSFVAGTLPVLIGRKKSILLFNAFYAVSYLLILFGGNSLCIALAFFMTGLARGATSNFCNTTINNLAPGKAWIINGLHAMFSVGAFLFPILLTVLTKNGDGNWVYACGFMAVMGVISWILYFRIPVEQDAAQKKKETNGSFVFFQEPMFYLCILTLFFYLCAEQGVIGWLVTYFKDTGLLNASLSQMTASIQWIMILAGRLATAWLSTRVAKEKLLRIMGIGLVVFFVVLITGTNAAWIMIGIIGFGFSMAGIYPTTVSFAGNLIKDYPMSWSFILTLASIGSIVMPSIIGKIADAAGIAVGMSSVAVVVVIDLIFIFILTGFVRRKEQPVK